jgi:hypothetical protein
MKKIKDNDREIVLDSHKFKGRGLGTSDKQPPVSVKLPPEIDAVVRLLPNRSDYLRQAIIDKLQKDGLLNLETVNS